MATGWKLAWITGASSGIGRELAVRLADRGTQVAATARSRDRLDALAGPSQTIFSFPADVTDAECIGHLVDEIERAHGPIELAVLNAGFWEQVSAETFDAAVIQKTMDVNYQGVVHCLAALLPRMTPGEISRLADAIADDVEFHGPAPIGELVGREAVDARVRVA